MSIHHVAGRVAVVLGATSVTCLAFALTLSGPAGAATPTQGSIVPNSAVPVGTVTAGTPFSSGQLINVVVGPNSVFQGAAATQNVQILECAAPNGVPPTSPTACDGETQQSDSFAPQADGSFNYQAQNAGDLYTLYALPDNPTFSEPKGGPACGNTLATECILFIGDNQGDFTSPHVWSQPFMVTANNDDLGESPGDGTPEVPIAVMLPLAAMGLLGGSVLIARRRAGSGPSSS
jgi:hypothetical protein